MDEQIEVLRRICERMKKSAEKEAYHGDRVIGGVFVDYANHMLAEVQALKRLNRKNKNG